MITKNVVTKKIVIKIIVRALREIRRGESYKQIADNFNPLALKDALKELGILF